MSRSKLLTRAWQIWRQGYVPFVADSLGNGRFVRADEKFSFPYGFKHGTILTITTEQYEAVKGYYK